MATPLKIPVNDSRPVRQPLAVLWVGLFAVACLLAALLLPPLWSPSTRSDVAESEPALTPENAGAVCIRLSENPTGYLSSEAMQRRSERRRASCDMAFAAAPYDLTLKVAVARAMPLEQRAQSLAILREAAAQGSPEAYYEIYESHKSWDRSDLDVVPLVSRAEADHALRMAVQLGHPFSTQMLAILLDRGTTVKRDPAAARYWAERALANPAKDERRGNLLVLLARLLVTSEKPEERARGLEILEKMSAPGHYQYGAKTALANAIRRQDPVRARALLEEARRPDPGGATPPLAEMLIAGEGGPADPKRALSLLNSNKNSAAVAGVLGQVYLEGKLVPRNVQEAVSLIDTAGQWDLNARLQVLQILAANPETRLMNPKGVLYYAMEAAELDEPGAMTALIKLKLSANGQFQDKAGACKLIETAVARGDQSMASRLSECRAG